MKKLLYFLITIFCFLSCHKDLDIPPVIGDCSEDGDFPAVGFVSGSDQTVHFPNCYPEKVNYNPDNSNELIIWLQNKKNGKKIFLL